MFMMPIATAITAPLRSRWLVSVAILLTAPHATGGREAARIRRPDREWLDRSHAAPGRTTRCGRRALVAGPRGAAARPGPRARLPPGARHGLGAGPRPAGRRARPRHGAAPGGALGRGRLRARRAAAGHAAAEAGPGARPGRWRRRHGPAARPRRRLDRRRGPAGRSHGLRLERARAR